jgi:hypothetical protein
MRHRKTVLVASALAFAVVALGAIWMCFDDKPLVTQGTKLSTETPELTEMQGSASGLSAGMLVASQDEANFLLDRAASRFHNASARVVLRAGAARVQVSVPTPWSPFGAWLNLEAVVHETPGVPAFDKLRIGSLPVPAFVGDLVVERIVAQYGPARGSMKSVALLDSQVRVLYEWRTESVNREPR